MIILASAVIISLSNTNIFTRAEEAVDAANLKQVQSLAAMAWSEAYLDKIDDDTVDLEARVKAALEDNNIVLDKYDITVTDTGVSVVLKGSMPADWKASVREVTTDNVPIPVGFVKSPYPNEGTKNGDLVIYALTEQEIKDGVTDITKIDKNHQESLEKRNQFVWVPVDNFETKFVRTAFNGESFLNKAGPDDEYDEGKYWEVVLDSNNMPSQTLNLSPAVSPETLAEATAMYASVKKYGGFYIARYEVHFI